MNSAVIIGLFALVLVVLLLLVMWPSSPAIVRPVRPTPLPILPGGIGGIGDVRAISPSPSANIQSVLTYFAQRGTASSGIPWSAPQWRAIQNPAGWEPQSNGYYYASGFDTSSAYRAFFDNNTGVWTMAPASITAPTVARAGAV